MYSEIWYVWTLVIFDKIFQHSSMVQFIFCRKLINTQFNISESIVNCERTRWDLWWVARAPVVMNKLSVVFCQTSVELLKLFSRSFDKLHLEMSYRTYFVKQGSLSWNGFLNLSVCLLSGDWWNIYVSENK